MESLITYKQMFRMDRKPVIAGGDSPDAKKAKLKWPKEVILSNAMAFSEKSFYYWSFQDKSSSFWGWTIVGIVLFILLFPVWPDAGKIVVFYISLYLLIFLLGAILLRALLYLVVRPFGYEFWILPEIFESDSFIPIVSFNKADDAWLGWVFRGVILLFLGWIVWEVARDPGVIKEYAEVSQQSYHDVVSWGRLKIGVDKEDKVVKNAINYDKILSDLEKEDSSTVENASEESGRVKGDEDLTEDV